MGTRAMISVLDQETEMANAEAGRNPRPVPDAGAGLLGFSERPLVQEDFAYYEALGLTREQVKQVVNELREGMSPLTRSPKSK
jgi:hypothetical protein